MCALQTIRISSDATDVAAQMLRAGKLVAFPTETVYGLGADATNGEAVAAIFAAKNRPSFNPLIVHVPDLNAAQNIAEFSPLALELAQAFWPGPLTLTLPLRADHGLSDLITAGLANVALRIPANPLAQELLRQTNRPIAAPSANLSTTVSPTSAEHVLKTLDGRIDGVLDGGFADVGLESTIVSVIEDQVQLLRLGGLSIERIEAVIKQSLIQDLSPDTPSAPGQMLKHYATSSSLIINCTDWPDGAVTIGFGDQDGQFNLSRGGNLTEAAAQLFATLHAADSCAKPDQIIAVAPIPNTGLGLAINDRLSRAAS